MFVLPPRPPKEHVLRDVTSSLRSEDVFTPFAEPRVTQHSLAKYCYPIQYADKEVPEIHIDSVNPSVLDRWADHARAWWVDKPGKNAYYLHDVYKKHSVVVDESYDPRFKPRERIFNRSFKYELDCIEDARLQKMKKKVKRETALRDEALENLERREKAKEKPQFTILPCKVESPFWWEKSFETKNLADDSQLRPIGSAGAAVTEKEQAGTFLRWQPEPKLLQTASADPCQRRLDMNLVGQPFQSEACNWYYRNYPPPKLNTRIKKFS